MRLLQRSDTGDFSLTKDFLDDEVIAPYAILSHTWEDGQEVTYTDLMDGTERARRATTKSSSADNRPNVTGYTISGWILAASTNQITPSFRRLSFQCFAGTRMQRSATSFYQTSQQQSGKQAMKLRSTLGSQPFEQADGSPGAGPSKSFLPQLQSSSSPEMGSSLVIDNL